MTKYVTQDNLDKLHPDVRKIADEVVDKMHSKDTYFFDIIRIVAICNCVISVIRLIYVCYSNNADRALQSIQRPGLFQRLFIKREIRKNFTFYYAHGNMPNKSKVKKDLYGSIVSQSQKMNAGDIENILGIYKNHGLFIVENK